MDQGRLLPGSAPPTLPFLGVTALVAMASLQGPGMWWRRPPPHGHNCTIPSALPAVKALHGCSGACLSSKAPRHMLHEVCGLDLAPFGDYCRLAQHGQLRMHHDCIVAARRSTVLPDHHRFIAGPLDGLQGSITSLAHDHIRRSALVYQGLHSGLSPQHTLRWTALRAMAPEGTAG